MKSFLILLFLGFLIPVSAQRTYHQLSEEALTAIENDSLQKAEYLLKEAMKLEPANPTNAMLFANLGWVQKQLGQPEKAVDSYTYALNMAPNTLSILLDRAALYMELGMTDQARYDYNRVIEEHPNNEEALFMRAYLNTIRREYRQARTDYQHLLSIDNQNFNAKLGLATSSQK